MSKKDEALKLALDYLLSKQIGAHIIATLREALAEQPAQQEPVAFFDPQSKGFYWAKPTKVIPPVTVDVEPLPLYTSPQRTWVGLTAMEIEAIGKPYEEKDRSIRAWGLFACAIEEELREKNV